LSKLKKPVISHRVCPETDLPVDDDAIKGSADLRLVDLGLYRVYLSSRDSGVEARLFSLLEGDIQLGLCAIELALAGQTLFEERSVLVELAAVELRLGLILLLFDEQAANLEGRFSQLYAQVAVVELCHDLAFGDSHALLRVEAGDDAISLGEDDRCVLDGEHGRDGRLGFCG
jgi:hypothetical protein